MATSYEEIKTKYAEAVRIRRTRILSAQSKVDRLTAMIEYYTNEREQYRQGVAPISSKTASMWNTLTSTINRLNNQLNEAKMHLSEAQIGEQGVTVLKESMNL